MKIDDEHKDLYIDLLTRLSEIVAGRPELLDSMRESLQFSAKMMCSNRPEAVSEFRELTDDVDHFLHACKTGEIDPKSFCGRKKENE